MDQFVELTIPQLHMLANEGKPAPEDAGAADAWAVHQARARAREATARLEAGGSLAPAGGVNLTPAELQATRAEG